METLLSMLGLVDDAKQLSKVALSKIGKESEIFDIIIDNDGTTRIQLKSDAPHPTDCTVYIVYFTFVSIQIVFVSKLG